MHSETLAPAPYNILSLDGGGSWALIQVRCLQKLFGEDKRGHEILRHFDLVAANSGGGIVLAGLVANLPLSAILAIFCTEYVRRDIFTPTQTWPWRWLHALSRVIPWAAPSIGPRYSTAHKYQALEAHFTRIEAQWNPNRSPGGVAALCLEDVPAYVGGSDRDGPHVLITTFDYNRQRAAFFRSDKGSYGDSAALQHALVPVAPLNPKHKSARLLQAVHASSTAPVNFFDTPACLDLGGQLNYHWDGGVAGYNNPVMAAVTEALTNDVAAEAIRVLSIGTGTAVFPVRLPGVKAKFPDLVTEPTAEAGFLPDIRKLASSILSAPPDAASFEAFTALNPGFVPRWKKAHEANMPYPNRNFIRANPSVQPHLVRDSTAGQDRWMPPTGFSKRDIRAIRQLELDAITAESVALIVRLCDAWIADDLPNQPIRASATLECLLGQNTFRDVEKAFLECFPARPRR